MINREVALEDRINELENQVLGLESDLKLARVHYQEVCDKLGQVNRKVARKVSQVKELRFILLNLMCMVVRGNYNRRSGRP